MDQRSNAPMKPFRTVEDLKEEIEQNGLDPRYLIVPPPLAIDIDPTIGDSEEGGTQKIPNMRVDSLLNPGVRTEERRETKLIRSFFHFHGSFIPDIIEGFNAFVRGYVPQHHITIRGTNVRIVFGRVRFTRPTVLVEGKVMPLYPAAARAVHSYMSHIFCDLQKFIVDENGKMHAEGAPVRDIQVGSIPVMLKSILCRTYGLTDDELLQIGEDPNDPGGYFIVKGYEKLIVMTDGMRENRILLLDMKGEKGKEVRTTTRANLRKSSIVTKLIDHGGMLRVFYTYYPSTQASNLHSKMSDKDLKERMMNALQIFRIFGNQEDPQTIVRKYVLRFVRPDWVAIVESRLASTIYNLASQGDYITFILTKFEDCRDSRQILPGDGVEDIRKRFIKSVKDCFLSHMASDSDEARLLYYGMMIARYTEYLAGLRHSDDMNNYGLKRFVCPGERVERLFLKSFKRMIAAVEMDLDHATGSARTDINYIARRINGKMIYDTFVAAFTSSVWGTIKDPSPEENIIEPLNRSSYLAVLSHLTKINAKTPAYNPMMDIRAVQPSQFNIVCPSDTPERLKVGLVKHRAIGCIGSLERSEVFLELLVKPYLSKLIDDEGTSILLNGRYLGAVDGHKVYNMLLDKRRTGLIDYDTMISHDASDRVLYLHNDAGRPVSPLLIVNPETERLIIEEKNLWGSPFRVLLENGCVEYVDAYEQDTIKLATDYNLLALTRTLKLDLQTERERLIALRNDLESGNISATPPGLDDIENELTDLREKIIESNAKIQRIVADKQHWITMDILPDNTTMRDKRVQEVRRLKAEEEEGSAEYGRLNAQIKRQEEILSSTKSAYTIASLNEQIHSIEARIAKETTRWRYTHCMLSPDTIFSFAASVIPAANMQLATRVSYHCSKTVHALGIFSSTYPLRMDTNSKVLTWPSRPIFKSHVDDVFGLADRPSGENALVAIMPWGGFNQEDAVIMSQRAVDRGLFQHMAYHTMTSTLLKGDSYVEQFAQPPSREGRDGFIFEHIGDDGLPIIGRELKEGQAYVCKVRKTKGDPKPKYSVERVSYALEGVVERIILGTNHDGHEFVKIKLRQASKVIVADKVVARVAQKSTVSRILPDSEMPYMIGQDGNKVVPDVIFNPHGIPSRMSIGLLAELILSKYAALEGRDIDATSFRKIDLETAISYFKARGMDPYGREVFYHPHTDKPLETLVFAGICFYQVLPNLAKLKIRARNRGPKKLFTRQPSRGADTSQVTGMRIGTQERDALVAHGAAELLNERLCKASDEHIDIFCEECGRPANVNVNTGTVSCPHCPDGGKFGKVCYPHATKTFVQLMEGAGISVRFGFEPLEQTVINERGEIPEDNEDDEDEDEDENEDNE